MNKLVVVALLMIFYRVESAQLKFINAQTVKIYTDDEWPKAENIGYKKLILPHAQNDDLENPVVQLNGLTGFLEVCMETIEAGASVSGQDDDNGPIVQVQGNGCQCYRPSRTSLKMEFFCTDSCQTSDTDFYYRFVKSPEQPRDTWCSERTQKFPSDNRAEPGEVPLEFRKHRTPPPSGKGEVDSGADMHFISLPAFIIVQAIVTFCLS